MPSVSVSTGAVCRSICRSATGPPRVSWLTGELILAPGSAGSESRLLTRSTAARPTRAARDPASTPHDCREGHGGTPRVPLYPATGTSPATSHASAGGRSDLCVPRVVPTSAERPIEGGSVTRCDGYGVNGGNGSSSRASPGGRPGAALPRVRGPLDQADRGPSRAVAGNGQGVLLMRREAPCCIPGAAGRDSEEGPWV